HTCHETFGRELRTQAELDEPIYLLRIIEVDLSDALSAQPVLIELEQHGDANVLRVADRTGHVDADVFDVTDLDAAELHRRSDTQARDRAIEVDDHARGFAKVAMTAEDEDARDEQCERGDYERSDNHGRCVLAHADSLSAVRVRNAWTRGF